MHNEDFRRALADSPLSGGLRPPLLDWVENGVLRQDAYEGLLTAIITGNFPAALGHAEGTVVENKLEATAKWIYQNAPVGATGPRALLNWPLYIRASAQQGQTP